MAATFIRQRKRQATGMEKDREMGRGVDAEGDGERDGERERRRKIEADIAW